MRQGLPELPARRRRTWPIFLGLLVVVFLVFSLSATDRWIDYLDMVIARGANTALGLSRTFDMALAILNSKVGDAAVGMAFIVFVLMHVFAGHAREEKAKRLAFWGWVAITFIVFYQCQRLLENFFDRDSPGKVLSGWRSLKRMYGFNARVENTHSFPSGHATAQWLFALMALRAYRRVGTGLVVVALILPSTRILTGAHWPSDILLGSIPLAAFASAVAYETPFITIYYALCRVLSNFAFVYGTGKRRSLANRIRGAYREFMLPEPSDVDRMERGFENNNEQLTSSGDSDSRKSG